MSLQDVADARVVVVDDNAPSAQLVHALLGRAGLHGVEIVTDPRRLLAEYDVLRPELVLLDLHMPGMDGYTMLGELRRRATATDLPVLVLTADTTREATHRALQLGANDFLTKPLDAVELVLRTRNLLQARTLHVALQRRHRWLDASNQLARDLLSGSCDDPLRRVCQLARGAADADLAVIAPARPDGADGTIIVGNASADGPETEVPLEGRDGPVGALRLRRNAGRPAFSETELSLAYGFAGQAAVAIEFVQARADQERMLVLADRDRIARDLHDQVIQRLFATGLRLQQLASGLEPGQVSDRIAEHVGSLDDTITEIRSTIFGLRRRLAAAPDPLPVRLSRLTSELTEILGFEPVLRIGGPADPVPDDVADDLVAAAREAITNVARHASARQVQVSLDATAARLTLDVVDDGVGIGDARRRSGLTNLCERARRHGGCCEVGTAPAGGGTRITWTVPLPGVDDDATPHEHADPEPEAADPPVTELRSEPAQSFAGTIATGR